MAHDSLTSNTDSLISFQKQAVEVFFHFKIVTDFIVFVCLLLSLYMWFVYLYIFAYISFYNTR